MGAARQRHQRHQRLERRLLAWLGLVGAVTLAHLWLSSQLLVDSWGFGAEPGAPTARMEVSFVRDLQQAAPGPAPVARAAAAAVAAAVPASAAQRKPQRQPRKAPAELSAPAVASTPATESQPVGSVANSLTIAPAEVAHAVPPPAQALQTGADAATTGPGAAPNAAAAQSAPSADDGAGSLVPPSPTQVGAVGPATIAAFEWPPSTRLTYILTGNYRGPVEGQARVEWLTNGGRYQVHLDASVGPSFAPLVTRRLSSEGVITTAGLAPRRYEEVTTVPLRAPRRVDMVFTEERVRLANGNELPRPSGLQDSASQFVQMTWLFTTQPQLLEPGRSIVMPLALPGRVEPWTYAVRTGETLHTPIGAVPTVHVQPQRGARPGDLTVEFWVAPSLQNLPVRILIRQDAENFIDLKLDRLPQQAGSK